MADEPDKKHGAEHLEKYQWPPGQTGNPKGRPKNRPLISDAYRKILGQVLPGTPYKDLPRAFKRAMEEMISDGCTVAEFVAMAQMRQALAGRTAAISEIADRTEGKPKQQHTITGPNEGPLQNLNYDLEKLSVDELRTVIEILAKAGPGDSQDDSPTD